VSSPQLYKITRPCESAEASNHRAQQLTGISEKTVIVSSGLDTLLKYLQTKVGCCERWCEPHHETPSPMKRVPVRFVSLSTLLQCLPLCPDPGHGQSQQLTSWKRICNISVITPEIEQKYRVSVVQRSMSHAAGTKSAATYIDRTHDARDT